MAAPAIAQARPWRGVIPAIIAAVVLVGAAQLAPGSGYTLNLLMQAVPYAIAVAGIVVVLGYCGQISLTQAGFFGIGAYATAIGVVDYNIPFLAAWIGGLVVAAPAGKPRADSPCWLLEARALTPKPPVQAARQLTDCSLL